MAIRDSKTTKGGNRAYRMVRSKTAKGPDGYGKVVSMARERMMSKIGKDPGYNVTANHIEGGSHHEKDGGAFRKGTRAENTAESNRKRAKKCKKGK
jgi:hypothetical protein